MKILVFCQTFGFGGTERAAVVWAQGLSKRGHQVCFLAGSDGPKRAILEESSVSVKVVGDDSELVFQAIKAFGPDVIHEHVPGFLRRKNIGLDARKKANYVPVVQTNIFGRQDEALLYKASGISCYVSLTSAAQSFLRANIPIRKECFANNAVVSNPVEDSLSKINDSDVARLRADLGGEKVFILGRFGRPDWQKWSKKYETICSRMPLINKQIRFLFRSAPVELERAIKDGPHARYCLFLPPTSNDRELQTSIQACDAVLHLSRIGESFGFSIAEAMLASKPVIVNSSPDFDQAQLELIRHGIDGFHASSLLSIEKSISYLATRPAEVKLMGKMARQHILEIAATEPSVNKLEGILIAAVNGKANPYMEEDFVAVKLACEKLRQAELGYSVGENFVLSAYKFRGYLRNRRNFLKIR